METQSLLRIRDLLNRLEWTTDKSSDLTGTLQHIAQAAKTFFEADICVIVAINLITGYFMGLQTIVGDLLEENVPFEQPGEESLAQHVLKEGVVLVEDLDVIPAHQSKFTHSEDIHALVGVALHTKYRQKPLGVLYLNFRHRRQFDSDDYGLFQIFAGQASSLLEETWLLHRLQEVTRIGQEINQEPSTIDTLFQKLQVRIANIVDISHAFLLAVYESQTKTLDIHLQEEGRFIHQEHSPLRGAFQRVIETQQMLFIEHFSKQAEDLPFQLAFIPGTRPKESLIFMPLFLRDEPLGVLAIQHPEPYTYNQEDQHVLQLLATHIALALHNIHLYRSLYQLNATGQLLTQQLNSEHTLQAITDKILEATKADLVVLYPYESKRQRFKLPALIAGTLMDPTSSQSMFPNRSGDIATLMLHRLTPTFAGKSTAIYNGLEGDVRIRQETFAQREQIHSIAAMPLRVGEEAVGVLFVNFRQPQHFDATQRLFIEGLASYTAIALKNAQTFGTLSERRIRELEILRNIDRELNRNLFDLESVSSALLKLAYERVRAEKAAVLLYNPRTQALEVSAAIGPHAAERYKQTISLNQTLGITHWVLEHKRPALLNDVHRDGPQYDRYLPVAAEIVSELDVPLLDGEEVVGVLNFESTQASAFSREDEEFLVTLAGQAVLAIKNAQAYEREKRLAAETQALNEISKEITSQLDLARVFDLILEKALNLTHSTLGSLHLYDDYRGDLWTAVERGAVDDKKHIRLRPYESVVGHAAAKKRAFNVEDISQPPWDKIYMEFIHGTRSELAIPMLAGDKIRGVLNVESPLPANFNESDERLLQGLADLAVVALQNAERYDEAKGEAQRFALLYKAGQEQGQITELSQIAQAYDVITQIAEEHSQCQVVICRYDYETQEMVMVSSSRPQSFPHHRMQLGESTNGQVTQEHHTIVVHDAHQSPPKEVKSLKVYDPRVHSLVITPIILKDRYYGNLMLSHEDVGHFQGTDILFFEGLAQQLASTIYRLETSHERQEFEQRAVAAEAMSSIGQAAFELTHRWGNDLGLVRSYMNDIHAELKAVGVENPFIVEKLKKTVRAVGTVLDVSEGLKHEFLKSGEASAGPPVVIHPSTLLEEARDLLLPTAIQIEMKIDSDVALVRVVHGLVTYILHNLLTNAVVSIAPNF